MLDENGTLEVESYSAPMLAHFWNTV